MQSFDDVLSQLVTLLRRSDAGGFVPHPSRAAKTPRATGLVSYRDVYGCPSSNWGEGAYVPEPSTSPTTARACSQPPGHTTDRHDTRPGIRPGVRPSVRMPFRLFDDS